MKNMKLALLAGVALLSFSTAARAEITDYKGFYLGGFGGLSWENGQESTPYSPSAGVIGTTSEIQYDFGWMAGADAGWSWGNGLMTGLEYTYHTVNVDNIDPQSGAALSTDGDIKLQTLMAKATYELPLQMLGFIRPYAGAGMGVGRAEFNEMNISGFTVDEKKTVFAYEGFAGLAFNITPRLSATTEYRYVATGEVSANTNVAGIKTDLNQGSHNFLAGLRYQFGSPVTHAAEAAPAPMAPAPMAAAPAPRPAAPAPVAPVVAQTYIVFFDFDKSVLTPEAKKVLERAAQDVRVGRGARIQVVGHADRSGSNSYNQRLSERRASIVKGELVRLGVTGGQIATRGAGETEPRVPTADGVREAQNRRAEIIFQ